MLCVRVWVLCIGNFWDLRNSSNNTDIFQSSKPPYFLVDFLWNIGLFLGAVSEHKPLFFFLFIYFHETPPKEVNTSLFFQFWHAFLHFIRSVFYFVTSRIALDSFAIFWLIHAKTARLPNRFLLTSLRMYIGATSDAKLFCSHLPNLVSAGVMKNKPKINANQY